jgi:type I restriction enzyme M protein
MRRKLIEADLIECVLGLGPNLFYNSPMEACVVVCRTQKSKARRGKILFINAVNEVTRERAQSFLTADHLQRVVRAYQDFKDEPGFTRVVPIEEIRAKEGNLSIPLYVVGESHAQTDAATETAVTALPEALAGWLESSAAVRQSLQSLLVAEK